MMQMGFDRSVSQHALLMLDKLSASATPCPSAGNCRVASDWARNHHMDVQGIHRRRAFRIEGLPPGHTGDHVLPHVTTSPAVDVADGPEYAVSLQALPRFAGLHIDSWQSAGLRRSRAGVFELGGGPSIAGHPEPQDGTGGKGHRETGCVHRAAGRGRPVRHGIQIRNAYVRERMCRLRPAAATARRMRNQTRTGVT